MTTPDIDPKIQDLRNRLAAVIGDLNDGGLEDGQAMFYLGGSVVGLCDRGNAADWAGFKAGLPNKDYIRLLEQLQTEGNQMHADGKQKAAYALQAISLSLVASRLQDEVVAEGERLLDDVINATVANFRKNAPKAN